MKTSYRAGGFGTTNAMIFGSGVLVMAGIVALTVGSVRAGQNVLWSVIGGLLAIGTAFVFALLAAAGISTWRSVQVDTDARVLSVPGFTLRRGFYREQTLLSDLSPIRLVYRSEARNSRWRLAVTSRRRPQVISDSITSSRGPTAEVVNTAAARAVRALRAVIDRAQGGG